MPCLKTSILGPANRNADVGDLSYLILALALFTSGALNEYKKYKRDKFYEPRWKRIQISLLNFRFVSNEARYISASLIN